MGKLTLSGIARSASRVSGVGVLKVFLDGTAQSASRGTGYGQLAVGFDYGAASLAVDGSADLGNLTTTPSVAIDLGTLTS